MQYRLEGNVNTISASICILRLHANKKSSEGLRLLSLDVTKAPLLIKIYEETFRTTVISAIPTREKFFRSSSFVRNSTFASAQKWQLS